MIKVIMYTTDQYQKERFVKTINTVEKFYIYLGKR